MGEGFYHKLDPKVPVYLIVDQTRACPVCIEATEVLRGIQSAYGLPGTEFFHTQWVSALSHTEARDDPRMLELVSAVDMASNENGNKVANRDETALPIVVVFDEEGRPPVVSIGLVPSRKGCVAASQVFLAADAAAERTLAGLNKEGWPSKHADGTDMRLGCNCKVCHENRARIQAGRIAHEAGTCLAEGGSCPSCDKGQYQK